MYKKTCTGCEQEFETRNLKQEKCRKQCGRKRERTEESEHGARARKRAMNDTKFIGVDGEGATRYVYLPDVDEETGEEIVVRTLRHDYVLLSVGDKSLHRDGDYLDHEDIFSFLWECFEENPDAAFVGFFLGYDFTQWVKSLPEHAARSLFTKEGIARRKPTKNSDRRDPWPVRDGRWEYVRGVRVLKGARWEFDLLGNKRFKLRPYIRYEDVPTRVVRHQDGTESVEKVPRPWMYICDTGPFFQTSFLNAIHPKQWQDPVVTPEEYEIIERGKAHRSDAEFDDAMIEYNLLENEVLARVMRRVNEGFVDDGIYLTRRQWFGPGQAAQKWMANIGVPSGEEIREVVPQWARDAARKTYYGGWFEIFNHGPVPGDSYAYDINSAYPAVIAELPCLMHGVWTQGEGKPPRLSPGNYRMVYATVRGNDDWVGPLPYRDPSGSILRPWNVKGWYWWHEVRASQRAGLISKVEIHEWVNYAPCKCPPPMTSIRELYQGRLQVGKNSAAGKGKKLVYNSAYGKLAQSVGDPKFANPIWASLITAGCRTMILDAIATHPTKTKSLLMIATDGIVFKEPHPNLRIHATELGAWDEDVYENLSLFMPGLYWDDKARAAIHEGSAPKLKSRGVSARDLAKVIDRVDRLWETFGPDDGPPRVQLAVDWAMTSAKQAATRNKWFTCGEIVYDAVRILDGKPNAKRDPNFTPAWGGIRSFPYWEGVTLETTYYDRGFGEELEMNDDVGLMETPDGPVAHVMAWALRRD